MTTLTNTIVIALAIIASAYFLSTRPVTIKDTTAGGMLANSITVQGEGKVFAEPDTFLLGLQVTSLGTTSADAQSKTKKDIDTLRDIASKAGIDDKDIQTTQMTIFPEYDYLPTGEQKTKGFRATHGLALKLRNLKQVDALINQVTFSDAVQIQSMSYDIDDKTELYSQARKLGFEKAKQKASELASLANVTLEKPLSISDQVAGYYPTPVPMYQANVYKAEVAMDSSAGGASINPGQLEVTVQVNVVWGTR